MLILETENSNPQVSSQFNFMIIVDMVVANWSKCFNAVLKGFWLEPLAAV